MKTDILGLHHITAISNSAQGNHDFYTNVLGLRLVKKTVNFDDPGTYHFYFGDEQGTPGTIITFFPWEGMGKGVNGAGMATHTAYSVPEGSFDFWKKRLESYGIESEESVIFNEKVLSFNDPDGMQLQLVVAEKSDNREPWTTEEIGEEVAIRGFHTVTLTLRSVGATAKVLTDILGYSQVKHESNRYRFAVDTVDTANFIDIIEDPAAPNGRGAAGTNHHIASERIYFLGFSQGACLTLEFTSRNARRYGGIVAFTGGLIGDEINASNYKGDFEQTPVLLSTGDPDAHVPVDRVMASAEYIKGMNASVVEKVYPGKSHSISMKEIDLANQLIFGNKS